MHSLIETLGYSVSLCCVHAPERGLLRSSSWPCMALRGIAKAPRGFAKSSNSLVEALEGPLEGPIKCLNIP
jgi:hypothetical protein